MIALIPSEKPIQTEELGTSTPAVRVITTPIKIMSNDRIFEALGTGRAQQSIRIYPAVAEEILSINFKAGDRVQAGDVLVQLDDREEKLAVQMAEVNLKEAKSLLNRYELAVKDGAVPESEVDSARASVDVAKVELDQAKLELEERKIRAPFAGVVGLPRVDPGDRVDPSTLITGLDDRTILQVDFEVPEELAGALRQEQTVTATTPAYPDMTFSGIIEALESRVDPQKRTIMARANIENINDLLRPGMSFATRLELKGATYPTVPEISLQWGREGSFVWIIREDTAHKVFVRVVARTSGNVLVEGDLKENEPVVVEGIQRLQPNRRVISTELNEILEDNNEVSFQ